MSLFDVDISTIDVDTIVINLGLPTHLLPLPLPKQPDHRPTLRLVPAERRNVARTQKLSDAPDTATSRE